MAPGKILRDSQTHPIWTKLNPEFQADGSHILDANVLAAAVVPGGALGSPSDTANGVVFLASDNASYITGTELVIDGGLSA